ncbi:MAG: hypothetical protein C0167_02780, partial [Nitrososphaera sp.]
MDSKKGAAIAVGLAGAAAAAYYFLVRKPSSAPGTYPLTVQVEGGSGDTVTVEIEGVGTYTATEGSPVSVDVPVGSHVTLYARA